MVPCLWDEAAVEAAVAESRKRTRHYAKRQMTCLKRIEGIRYVDSEAPEAYAEIERFFQV